MGRQEVRMIRATRMFPAGEWSGIETDFVVLAHQDRHRRRLTLTGQRGLEFLLDLPRAVALRDGDGLVLEDGRIVKVRAAPEPLAEITAPDRATLLRLAWHLGNRHQPAELREGRIRIRRDHVIEAMIAGLGGTVKPVISAFEPEGGAYAEHGHGGHAEGHGQVHDQWHDQSHGPPHDHDHDRHNGAHDHAHDHDRDHGGRGAGGNGDGRP